MNCLNPKHLVFSATVVLLAAACDVATTRYDSEFLQLVNLAASL
ncbi:MAG TPA: hypothetical protein VM011_01615 [Gammaproteobacteria bacterium]|nr:hypothetical protein [Gammaproteobacteria bacterium]